MMSRVSLRMWRQLAAIKGRMLAITCIVAAAVAIYVGLFNAVGSVITTRNLLVERDRMADYQVYFWAIARDEVPDLSKVPGVESYEARLILPGTIALPGQATPLAAKVHPIPLARQSDLNRIEVVEGRYFQGEADLESAIVDKALATYHGFRVGDTLELTVGQATHRWKIIGIAISAEHLVATANPEFLIPQKGSLGVVYVPKEKQDDLLGAELVTNLSIRFRDPRPDPLHFDQVLKPYFSAIEVERYEARADNFAFSFLKKDIDSLSLFIPAIVAVFVVICGFVAFAIFGQVIRTQSQEIGTLMALGVPRLGIVRSFLVAALGIGLAAAALGLLLSLGVAAAFRSDYRVGMGLATIIPNTQPALMVKGALLAVVTAVVSIGLPTLRIVRLQPIEAVRPQAANQPPAPPGRLARWLGATGIARFSIRNVTRDRRRFVMTVVSIAGAIGVGLAYRTSSVSVDHTFEDYFLTDNWNLIVEYVEPQVITPNPPLSKVPHVATVEEYSKGNVKIQGPKAEKPTQVLGLDYPSRLKDHEAIRGRSPSGQNGEVFMNQRLANQLGVDVGSKVELKGFEDSITMTVVGIAAFSPDQVYVTLSDAQKLVKQEHKAAGALVLTTANREEAVGRAAGALPFVGNVYLKSNIVRALKTHAKELLGIISICIALAMMVACLVITSTAIINMLEREPDYAMVRVLGYAERPIARGILTEVLVTGALGLSLSVPLSFVISSYLNSRVGEAFFSIKTVQDPISILVVTGLTLAFLPLAARPGMKRIHTMNLAETVRRKIIG